MLNAIKSLLRPAARAIVRWRDLRKLARERVDRDSFVGVKGTYTDWYRERMERFEANRTHEQRDALPGVRSFMKTGGEDLETLRKLGLEATHELLEIGVGMGRSTQHFVRFVMADRFIGCDTVPTRVDYTRHVLEAAGLLDRNPRLVVIKDNRYDWLAANSVDFIWCRAVFNHLPEADIDEIMANIRGKLRAGGRFIFTYKEHPKHELHQYSAKNFYHSWDFIAGLAKKYSYSMRDVTADMAPDPRNVDYIRLIEYRI